MSEEDYVQDSFEDVLNELDKEKANVVISKDIRKWNKPSTLVKGLHNRNDVRAITKELKTKLGTGGTFKDNQIILQGDHREAVKSFLMTKGISEESIEVI